MTMRTLAGVVLAVGTAGPVFAQSAPVRAVPDEGWCRDDDDSEQRARTCAVYEATWAAGGPISVDARPNGGIEVNGWSRNEVRLRAKVSTFGDDQADARQIASQVHIQTGSSIRAEGPARLEGRRRSWWVSYRLDVPASSALRLESTNGGIHLSGVDGDISFNTTNGGLHLKDVGGKVVGRTTNGGVHVELDGTEWHGEGLDLVTTNGGVHIQVPRGYNARLEVGTTNGRVHADMSDVKTSRDDDDDDSAMGHRRARNVTADLGRGGRLLRIRTTNGSVHLSQE